MGQDAGPSTRLLSCAGRSRQEGRPDRQDQTGTGRSAAPGNDIPSPRALPIRREGVRAPVAPADQAVAGSWPDSWPSAVSAGRSPHLGNAAGPSGGHRAVFTAGRTLNREDRGFTWNHPSMTADSWGSGEIRFEINLEAVLQPNQHDCASQTEQIICVPPPLASVSKHIKR